MRIPDCLASLSEYGIIEEVLRPLMSGKEAQIYLVISGGEQRVAKVYKEAQNRTFKNRAEYTEGRKVRNSRDQRAMGKGTRHGRAQEEAAWRATEVEMIYRLRDAGVRVPVPYHFIDSVLIMEMVADPDGNPAPRLGDLDLAPAEAQAIFERLLAEVVRMLSAGVVHGDLSDFNVLIGADGPVVIDFPQAVDASSNQNARKLLVRDVDNLHRFMARFFPEHRALPYAQEMWQLYERGELLPDTKLTGRHRASEKKADTRAVLDLIGDANYDESKRRQKLGLKTRGGPGEVRTDTRLDNPQASSEIAARAPASRPARRAERDVTPQVQRGSVASSDRGGAGSDRGGASSDRGGASSDRGGASSDRGGASSDRGGASSDRGHVRYELKRRESLVSHDPSHTAREPRFRDTPPQQIERGSSARDSTRRESPPPQQRIDRSSGARETRYRDASPLPQGAERTAATRDLRYRDTSMPRASEHIARDTQHREASPGRESPSRQARYRDGPLHQADQGAGARDARYPVDAQRPQQSQREDSRYPVDAQRPQHSDRGAATRDSRYPVDAQRPQHSERGAATRDSRYRDVQRPQHSERGAATRDSRYRDAPQQSEGGAATRDSRYRDAPQQSERGVAARESKHRDAPRTEDQAPRKGRFSGSRNDWS